MNAISTRTTRIALTAAVATLFLTAACGSSEARPPEQASAPTTSTWSRPANLPLEEQVSHGWLPAHTTPPPSYWIGWEVWQRRSHVL